jgi:hypothetical protein
MRACGVPRHLVGWSNIGRYLGWSSGYVGDDRKNFRITPRRLVSGRRPTDIGGGTLRTRTALIFTVVMLPYAPHVASRKSSSQKFADTRAALEVRLDSRYAATVTRLLFCCLTWCLIPACAGNSNGEAERPEVKLGEPSKDVDPKIIGEAVRARAGRFQFCYEVAREANPELAGRIVIRFAINPDGSIPQAMAFDTNLPSNAADCVVQAFYGIQLPEREDTVIAEYPMFFDPN